MFDSIKTFAGDSRVQFFAMGFVAGATVLAVASLLARPKDLVEATVETAAKVEPEVAADVTATTDTAAEKAADAGPTDSDDNADKE